MNLHERKKIVDLRPGAAGHASHLAYKSGHPVLGILSTAAGIISTIVNHFGEHLVYKCPKCGAHHEENHWK